MNIPEDVMERARKVVAASITSPMEIPVENLIAQALLEAEARGKVAGMRECAEIAVAYEDLPEVEGDTRIDAALCIADRIDERIAALTADKDESDAGEGRD